MLLKSKTAKIYHKVIRNVVLHPHLDDPNFNTKIAERKEFNDTKYDGTYYNIEEQAEKMCNADFELAPHRAKFSIFRSTI